MRAVIQRVSSAQVDIDGETAGSIGHGLLILLGVGHGDGEEQAERLWSKIARLRIFEDADGKTNLSLADVGGEVLVVSQFTLYASCKKGNRPRSRRRCTRRGQPPLRKFVERARRDVARVETGRFGAYMDVSLVNDGPLHALPRHRRALIRRRSNEASAAARLPASPAALLPFQPLKPTSTKPRPPRAAASPACRPPQGARVRFLVAHARVEERLHVAPAVHHAARVEEAPQRQPAGRMPRRR